MQRKGVLPPAQTAKINATKQAVLEKFAQKINKRAEEDASNDIRGEGIEGGYSLPSEGVPEIGIALSGSSKPIRDVRVKARNLIQQKAKSKK